MPQYDRCPVTMTVATRGTYQPVTSSPGGWTRPLTLVLWGLFSLFTGALTTAEAAKCALAESRVLDMQSVVLAV